MAVLAILIGSIMAHFLEVKATMTRFPYFDDDVQHCRWTSSKPEPEPTEALELAAVWSALDRLPERERLSLLSRCGFQEVESRNELAQKFGRSPQTISNWAEKAVRRVRDDLQRGGLL